MIFLYLFYCVAVPVTLARPEPPVLMELQQQNQRTLPLNTPIQADNSYIYQQLPEEHSFTNFVSAPSTFSDSESPPSTNTFDLPAFKTTAVKMPQEDSYNYAYRHSLSQQHQTGYESGPTETQVHKHIYVHVPPKDFEDEDSIQPHITHQVSSKQKHYKIIFIKTPTVPEIRTPIVSPPMSQQEEKTLIYVLHKKPELLSNIVIPTPEPTTPSKPEVYFIKYKATRDEAPVYGPPPAIKDLKSRQAVENKANEIMSMDLNHYEMMTTTQQPQYLEEEEHTPFFKEEPSEVGVDFFNASTEIIFMGEKVEATTIEPQSQQMSAETTVAPIVVKEMQDFVRLPSTSYGAPNRNRLINKKRK